MLCRLRRDAAIPARQVLAPVVAAAALLVTAPAHATESVYFRGPIYFNTPSPGACAADTRTGRACSGSNYWDYSRNYYYGYGDDYIGFIFGGSHLHFTLVSGTNQYRTVAWNDPAWASVATHYNRALTVGDYWNGAWVDAIGLIYP